MLNEVQYSSGIGFTEAYCNIDRTVRLANVDLVIPAVIQQQTAQLDQFVASGQFPSEIFGVGLTKKSGNRVEVIEFIAPEPDKVFKVDCGLFMNVNQAQFMEHLSSAVSVNLRSSDSGVVVEFHGSGDPQVMSFPSTSQGNLDYSFTRKELSQFFGFPFPESVTDLRDQLTLAGERQIDRPVELDAIVNVNRAIITGTYLKRVHDRAIEAELDMGYTVHHHPSLALAALILQDKGVQARYDFYTELLKYSPNDLTAMKSIGATCFEIRALGNLGKPFDYGAGITSRYYQI